MKVATEGKEKEIVDGRPAQRDLKLVGVAAGPGSANKFRIGFSEDLLVQIASRETSSSTDIPDHESAEDVRSGSTLPRYETTAALVITGLIIGYFIGRVDRH